VTGDLLTTVVAAARRSAAARAARVPRETVERTAAARPRRGRVFREALRQSGVRVIAECKRRSPSRGVLRPAYDPVAIATSYASHGAAAISVLTEPTFFDGSLDHLRQVRTSVDLPLLCKDFIVTDYQVIEAAAAGADAVLLIVAALEDAALTALGVTARACGLDVLVEVHDRLELGRALDTGAEIVGVNSRNLRTLEVDTVVFDELAPLMPASVVAVAESGLRSAADVARVRAVRYDGFLIGERFMMDADPGVALGHLRAAADLLQVAR
jgi:indole-3-glycerol phosphate synthase